MPGFVIFSVFEVGEGRTPLGADVLGQAWGVGHRFSYCDGRTLTLVVELTAVDVAAAFESVLSRAELVWTTLGFAPLPPPTTMRVQGAVQAGRVAAGAPGAEPGWKGSRRRRLSRQTAVSRDLTYRATPADRPPVDPDDPDRPDEGGLAGVREPRRPGPSPGGAAFAIDPPEATIYLP
jgi:hypothetical protein